MDKDPKSDRIRKCRMCGGGDIRVHFSDKPEKYQIDWCVKCGVGHNPTKGFVDCMIFGSCLAQMDKKDKKCFCGRKIKVLSNGLEVCSMEDGGCGQTRIVCKCKKVRE